MSKKSTNNPPESKRNSFFWKKNLLKSVDPLQKLPKPQ
jgi:hypothetical protein